MPILIMKLKTSAGKPSIYHFDKLQKGDSTLIFDDKGQIAMYSNKLQVKICNAIYSWRKYNYKRKNIKIVTRKSKEFDEVANDWYYAVRVTRIK
jgi:hypothetical protein